MLMIHPCIEKEKVLRKEKRPKQKSQKERKETLPPKTKKKRKRNWAHINQ